MFHSPVNVNKKGNIVINGNGAKLITNGFTNMNGLNNDFLLNFGDQLGRVYIEDLQIDGRNALASGIYTSSSFIGDGLTLSSRP